MNELNNHDSTSLATDDSELESLVNDAFDAPPIPRSLLRRIDRGVAAEWGESPGLAPDVAGKWTKSMARAARWAKSVPAAACVVMVVILGVMLNGNGQAYGWASMMQALAERGIIQIEDENGTRWLSLSDGVLGERTTDSTRLLDAGQQVILERIEGASEIRRRPLATNVSVFNRDRLMLDFLLGGAFDDGNARRLDGARLINESWDSVKVAGVDQVALTVAFENAAAERFDLEITVDPDSQLPSKCELLDDDDVQTRFLTLTYPLATVTVLREREFPAGLQIVDLDEYGQPLNRIAVGEVLMSGGKSKPDTEVVAVGRRENMQPVQEKPLVEQPVVTPVEEPQEYSDAPSDWKPVKPVEGSTDEIVRQADELLAELWQANAVTPTVPADDSELLRRVYLDLAGRTPSVSEVRAFDNDKSLNRFESLVDRLLKSPDHASHLATVWRTFLIPEGVDLTAFGGVEAFDEWLARRFASGDSYDDIVRSLLLADGRLVRSGPLLFYSAAKLDPDQLASRTARVFLGMRLECAQCHDHPFEPWAQDEFWGFAAFFARISRPKGTLESVSTVLRVSDVDRGEVMLPDTEQIVAPKFLDGAEFLDGDGAPARRQQLADWLTAAKNPFFARATANRVWGQLFGKGIVDPIDDFGLEHQPKSPELLDLLAGHFVSTDFSLRELFRSVVLSKAYRLSSGAASVDDARSEFFAQMNIKTLSAEQVYDCISVATLLDSGAADDGMAFNVARIGNSSRAAFIQQFRTPVGRNTEYQGGIPQALTLMNGGLIEGATGLSSSGLLKSLEAPFFTNKDRIEVLYLATLSRRPRSSEWELLNGYISDDARGSELQEGLADILWALLNSAEFTLNH
tara:strand:- start:64657 stop:67230 length:2574 start_codon:yes stop_codon:yes gene_type:complete